MHHFHYHQGRLFCEGIPVETIAEAVGTPFYCYSHATLTHHFQAFDGAFGPLMHFLVEDQKLSKTQKEELLNILEQGEQKCSERSN